MESDQPGPAKKQKITSVTDVTDICNIDQKSPATIKYMLLTQTQTFARNHKFPQQQCGLKASGKPHMHSFSLSWLDEFKADGLVYSVSCSEEFQGISFFLYNYETQKLTKVFT